MPSRQAWGKRVYLAQRCGHERVSLVQEDKRITSSTSSEKRGRASPLGFIILSASLFGLSVPFSKILLDSVPAVPLAGLLYLGAFAGLFAFTVLRRAAARPAASRTPPLERKDIPWLAGATVSGGIVAPVSLMLGLTLMSGFSTSLLLNLEGVTTAIIAVLVFRENAGRNLWLALVLMTGAGVLLGWDPSEGTFDLLGLALVVLAMVCWGIDNNLTRMICSKDAVQIAQVKGLLAGASIVLAAALIGEELTLGPEIGYALIVGALSYGASLVLFIKSLERLGSLRTGVFFSLGPFIGAAASIVLLGDWLGWMMLLAGILMGLGVWLIATEKHQHYHVHETVIHNHEHEHCEDHHMHEHFGTLHEPHSHEHTHEAVAHEHTHRPDTHHRHRH